MLSRTLGSVFGGRVECDMEDTEGEPPLPVAVAASNYAPIELRVDAENENQAGYRDVFLRALFNVVDDRLSYQIRNLKLDDILVSTNSELAVRAFLGSLQDDMYKSSYPIETPLIIRAFFGASRAGVSFCGTEYEIKPADLLSEQSVKGVLLLLHAHTTSPIRIARTRKRSRPAEEHSERKWMASVNVKRDPDEGVTSGTDAGSVLS